MQKIEGALKARHNELKQVEYRNGHEERELIAKKKQEAQLLASILQQYDAGQRQKQHTLAGLRREADLIRRKSALLAERMRRLRMEKECKMTLDIEWNRKKSIMRLETEEQVSALRFVVNFWKIQNMKRRRKKKRRRRKKKAD